MRGVVTAKELPRFGREIVAALQAGAVAVIATAYLFPVYAARRRK
jgi:hypothetical protein